MGKTYQVGSGNKYVSVDRGPSRYLEQLHEVLKRERERLEREEKNRESERLEHEAQEREKTTLFREGERRAIREVDRVNRLDEFAVPKFNYVETKLELKTDFVLWKR